MATFDYRYADEPATIFVQDGDQVWLRQLFGLACGFGERDEGPPRARGLALIETDAGRLEADALRLAQAALSEDEMHLVWQSADSGLRLESLWTFSRATGLWQRRDTLTNAGPAPIILRRCLARYVFAPDRYEVYAQRSTWCNENQGTWQPLHGGSIVLGCEGGRTTQGNTPFMALRAGHGGAIAFHLLPRGNWTIRVCARAAMGDTHPFAVVELGLADEDLRLELAPGAALPLPEILLQHLPGGEAYLGAPRLHAHLLQHGLVPEKDVVPVMYNTWFYAFEDLPVARLREQLAVARDLGCEVFTVDAGWYGQGTGHWAAQVGDWREKRDAAFDGRMADFAAEVRAAGLGFGLWMEPERIGPAAPILREHPEWFLPASGGFYRPDLERPDAYAYLLGEMARLVKCYKLAWMKVDFNLDLGVDASGAEFAAYYAAWYRLLDELRARFPKVFFEGCASGGMRSDLNTLRHFHGHFLSDTVNPLDVLRIGQGAWLRLPPGYIGKWAVLRGIGRTIAHYGVPLAATPESLATPVDATWERSMTVDVDFAARVCLPGMFGLSGDLSSLSAEAKDRLRLHIALFKTWRRLIARSVAHLLTPPRPKEDHNGWAAVQLQHPDEGTNLLFAYRLDDGCPRRRFYPRALGDALYRVTDIDWPDDEPRRCSGAELMRNGLEVMLPTRYSAAILCLERE